MNYIHHTTYLLKSTTDINKCIEVSDTNVALQMKKWTEQLGTGMILSANIHGLITSTETEFIYEINRTANGCRSNECVLTC
jgi:hypothetical protein